MDTPPDDNIKFGSSCVQISGVGSLGGFLARKGDKQPGITHIWRGMIKFAAIVEGATLAKDICG
ncbi:MAG: hypothetical protein A2268_06960 [Candidatus Raymondbacteria bacterium RifOxyA12_full_50_37]|uniref:Transposase Tn5 dimerisation domain-containing protein n=1 Tax=Candidatus Raymondbacteria bacterium RIFOXYD12_FULL_49_13 TaxID=1817890 RepID=A0A1F7FE83_UNCRA|nr:MAG: hypothetical protein A2268_06960 [Candidatus Raymondbacteria bacterium RifOxyA12_full_50_37]OGJ91127.1 MAG: hypothetical protein A2248_01115 [Candidatus Raymondbacteria bacterium RIFOXYA2_FULL_49_16]OGJ97524.1 MAG: hypothetical protein A2453_01875 [Candidatus Raymondbacteria bacterium RIFOXYC2_FULL_50_21]OGK00172.1 MAG: hypothetical protein A2350_16425 [Candidatus Raymondbacteria bacterium RifOxyB12_full_50_8]OGK04999.1 MAG: hypothetical protein A2519_09985 [Candidatus Raymondbacteria b